MRSGAVQSSIPSHLPLAHLGGHVGIVLLEALREALAAGHVLLDAAGDAAVLALGHGLGGEVADARGEAVVDEVAEELRGRREGRDRSALFGEGEGGKKPNSFPLTQ